MKLPKRVDHKIPRVRRDLANALRETGLEPPGAAGVAPPARRRRPRTRSSRRCGARCAPTPCTAGPTATTAPGGPSGTRGWPARTTSSSSGSGRPRTRWRAPSTASAGCSPSGSTWWTSPSTAEPDRTASPSPRDGRRLSRLWGESDLLVAECLRHGVWVGLEPAELAAVASSLVYDSRRDDGGIPRVPDGAESAMHRHRPALAGPRRRRAPPPPRPHPRARPRLRLAGAPLGAGGRALGGALVGALARHRALGGRLRALVPPGARPARPDPRGLRRRGPGGPGSGGRRAARSGAGWSRSGRAERATGLP